MSVTHPSDVARPPLPSRFLGAAGSGAAFPGAALLVACAALLAMGCVARRYNAPPRASVKVEDSVSEGQWTADQLAFSKLVHPLWTYRCGRPAAAEPTLCTGTALDGTDLLVTANHCVAKERGVLDATLLIPKDNDPSKSVPPPFAEACGKDAPEGWWRTNEWTSGSSTVIGSDVAFVKVPGKGTGAGATFATVADVRDGDTVWGFGYGFSECEGIKMPTEGVGTRRLGKFSVSKWDRSRAWVYLERGGSLTCPADSGMSYLVEQGGALRIFAVHKGKPGKTDEADLSMYMYGTSVGSFGLCEALGKAGIKEAFGRNCKAP